MSLKGLAPVTYGTGASKFSGGGGDVVYHSRVSASHGSLPARLPLRRVTHTFTKKSDKEWMMALEIKTPDGKWAPLSEVTCKK